MLLPAQRAAWNQRCGADFLFFRQWFLDFKLWPAHCCNFIIWLFSKTENEVHHYSTFSVSLDFLIHVYYLLLLLKSPKDDHHNQWLRVLFFFPHFKLLCRLTGNVLADAEPTFLLKIHKGVKRIWWRVWIWVFVFMSTVIKSKQPEDVCSAVLRYICFILHLYNNGPAKFSHSEVCKFLHTVYAKEGKTYIN